MPHLNFTCSNTYLVEDVVSAIENAGNGIDNLSGYAIIINNVVRRNESAGIAASENLRKNRCATPPYRTARMAFSSIPEAGRCVIAVPIMLRMVSVAMPVH